MIWKGIRDQELSKGECSMYRVQVELEDDQTKTKEFTTNLSKENLEKLLGRYLLRYGTPIDMQEESRGYTEYAYYRKLPHGFASASVRFWKILTDEKKTTTVVAPEPEVKIEQVEKLFGTGVFTRAS